MSQQEAKGTGQGSQGGARRLARLAAVQALYQIEVNGGEPATVVRWLPISSCRPVSDTGQASTATSWKGWTGISSVPS